MMTMDKKLQEHIEELLRLYDEARTTDEQERELAEFFCQTDEVPEAWKGYARLFATFAESDSLFTEAELDELLPHRRPTRPLWPWMLGAAATVALLIGLFLHYPQGEATRGSEYLALTEQTSDFGNLTITAADSTLMGRVAGMEISSADSELQEAPVETQAVLEEEPIQAGEVSEQEITLREEVKEVIVTEVPATELIAENAITAEEEEPILIGSTGHSPKVWINTNEIPEQSLPQSKDLLPDEVSLADLNPTEMEFCGLGSPLTMSNLDTLSNRTKTSFGSAPLAQSSLDTMSTQAMPSFGNASMAFGHQSAEEDTTPAYVVLVNGELLPDSMNFLVTLNTDQCRNYFLSRGETVEDIYIRIIQDEEERQKYEERAKGKSAVVELKIKTSPIKADEQDSLLVK